MADETNFNPDRFAATTDALGEFGWVHIKQFLAPQLMRQLAAEARNSDGWNAASVGISRLSAPTIRRDLTLWLNGETPAQQAYFSQLEVLRGAINQRFFVGLFEYEAHYAHYPPGAFYRKHIDALRGSDARVLTSVCYLNEQWRPDDGGELMLYGEDQKLLSCIAPTGGDLVLFWSEDFPHEVLPAHADRYSISGWFRRNQNLSNPI